MTSSYKLAILLSSERKIYMVTNMLIKTRSIFNYLKLIFHVFVLYCFVLLESSGGHAETPNAFIFSLNNFEGLAPFVSKVKKRKYKNGHLQEFSYWTSVWSGPFNFF